jgi:hypothetical protein
LLEDEEEPHLNTDQVGCERNGSRVESPSANMPIVTGPKTPNTFFGTKILELGDGDHSPEWEARETEGTPRRTAGFTGDRQGRQGETEPPFQGLPVPSYLLHCHTLEPDFPCVSPLSPLSHPREERV